MRKKTMIKKLLVLALVLAMMIPNSLVSLAAEMPEEETVSEEEEASQEENLIAPLNEEGAETTAEVSTYEELAAALAAGKDVTLTEDITAEGVVSVTGKACVIDLNSKKLTLSTGGNYFTDSADVTIKNGTLDITGVTANGDCIIGIGNYSTDAELTLDSVNVTGDGYSSAYAVFYVYGSSTLNINGGSVVVANDSAPAGGVIKAESAAKGKINITGTADDPVELQFTDAKIGFLDGTVNMNYVDLDINGGSNAINQSALTVKNSSLTIKDCDGRALTLKDGDVTIENSTLDFSGASEGEIRFKAGVALNLDASSYMTECDAYADSGVSDAKVNDTVITATEENLATVVVVNGEETVKVKSSGDIVRGYLYSNEESGKSRVTVDMYNVTFYESVALELYSGENLLTTATLNTEEFDAGTYGELTGSISISGSNDTWPCTEWTAWDSTVPTAIKLVVDGEVVDTYTDIYSSIKSEIYIPMTEEDWVNFPGTLVDIDGDIFRAYLNSNKGRISLDILNVTFYESLELKLYSGEELLTTSKLNTEEHKPGTRRELTGAIYVSEFSDTWPTDEWTAWDSKVPTKIELVADGKVVDTYTEIYSSINPNKIMEAQDWIDFPGTLVDIDGDIFRAYLNSEKGRITVDMSNVTFYESVALELYSGETLLTTAKLNTNEWGAGTYGELTGAICVAGTSDTWPNTKWTPLDGVVPTEIKLVVDGKVVDTYTEIYSSITSEIYVAMTAQDWIDFPGTLVEVPKTDSNTGSNTGSSNASGSSSSSSSSKEPTEVYYVSSQAAQTTTAPSTGDTSNAALWISVMGIAFVAVVAAVTLKKRGTK